jgi:N-acetylmuramoyl-L-alanine amidase
MKAALTTLSLCILAALSWTLKFNLTIKILLSDLSAGSVTILRSFLRQRVLILGVYSVIHSVNASAATCSTKAQASVSIILDVGHIAPRAGETCPLFSTCAWGETSARGVPEYMFNLGLARRIKDVLIDQGFRSTSVFTTELDGNRGLQERASIANNMQADLFISIHHDGVRDQFLTKWKYSGRERYYYDGASGFSVHVSPRYSESITLAKVIADQLIKAGFRFTTAHEVENPVGARKPYIDPSRGIYRREDLVLLNETRMPAVLLEGGFIVNRDEEVSLSRPDFQQKFAIAVAGAVKQFCGMNAVANYKVINVAPDDFLYVRDGPSADFSVVGKIPSGGQGVKIVGNCQKQWCEVDYLNTRGWANTHFLQPTDRQH